MIIRLLMTAMIVLAIAKYYLHDSKQHTANKPAQQIEDIKNQLDDIQRKQKEQTQKHLEHLGLPSNQD